MDEINCAGQLLGTIFDLQERPCRTKVRKLIPVNQNAPRGSHCGGTEDVCFADPPQAENFAKRNSFINKQSAVYLSEDN